MLTSSVICDVISFFVTRERKKFKKLMEIVYIKEKEFGIFWTTRGISMKFSRKVWLIIILKATKK